MASHLSGFLPMHFPARLIQLSKAASYTQKTLSDAAELHVNQIRRYEAGTAQPTLEALIRLAKTLHVSLDSLVFEEGERGPDEDLRLRFEALSQLDSNERMVVKELLACCSSTRPAVWPVRLHECAAARHHMGPGQSAIKYHQTQRRDVCEGGHCIARCSGADRVRCSTQRMDARVVIPKCACR